MTSALTYMIAFEQRPIRKPNPSFEEHMLRCRNPKNLMDIVHSYSTNPLKHLCLEIKQLRETAQRYLHEVLDWSPKGTPIRLIIRSERNSKVVFVLNHPRCQ